MNFLRAIVLVLSSALAGSATVLAGSALAAETFQKAITPSGLPFWHLQRADSPRSTIVGSFVDGFALAHPDRIATAIVGSLWMQSGPRGMSSGELNEQARDIEARGGISSGTMTATFSVEAKPEDLGEAVDLYFRTLSEPALRDIDLDRIRKGAVTSRARLENNPGAVASWLMRRMSAAATPFARWSEPEEIAKITAADVEMWRREVFALDNLTLVAVGTLDAAAFGALIDRSFGALPEKSAPRAIPAPAPVYSGRTIVYERETPQTAIVMEGPVSLATSEGPAVTIGNNVLGGGMDRRLGKAIRGEQGATYGISSGIGQLAPDQRNFSIRSSLANDLALAALTRTQEEYSRWRRDGVTETEVEGSRSLLATNFDKSVESPGGKAFALLQMLRTHRTVDDEATYTQKLRSVVAGDINRVLRERMPEKLTIVIVAPKADGFGADCVIRKMEEIDACK